MRKYLSLAVVALSSGGALIAAAGAASAATATDNWRAAPWEGSSPQAQHAAPFEHHGHHAADADKDVFCGAQKEAYKVGQIDIKLIQKACLGDLDEMPTVPGPPPVMGPPPMGSPEPCPVTCVPTPPGPPPVPCPPPVVKPPVPTPPPVPCPPPVKPPVPCPPPVPTPCPPGDDHKWSPAAEHGSEAAHTPAAEHGSEAAHAPAAGNPAAGLPVLGSALGGLL